MSGILSLLPGRYAICPCTMLPEKEGDFTVQVSSDVGIIMENNGDKMADADDEESDDEELGESEVAGGALDENEDNANEEDDDTRGLQTLMLMVGDLASYVKDVGGEIGHLEESCREVEAKLESAL